MSQKNPSPRPPSSPSSDHQADQQPAHQPTDPPLLPFSNRRSISSNHPHQSNLSNQLAELRHSYQQAGGSTPIQNIPLPRNSSNLLHSPSQFNEPSTHGAITPITNSLANSLSTHSNLNREIQLTRHSSFANNSPFQPFTTSSSLKPISRFPNISTVDNNSPRQDSNFGIDDLTDDQKAQIVRRHLMNKEEQDAARRVLQHQGSSQSGALTTPDARSEVGQIIDRSSSSEDPTPLVEENYPTPFHLQGGDIHHAVYKWANKQQADLPSSSSNLSHHLNHLYTNGGNLDSSRFNNGLSLTRTRSVSMSGSFGFSDHLVGFNSSTNHLDSLDHRPDPPLGLAYKDIMQPGGFRRAFLYQKRAAIGKPYEVDNDRKFIKSFIDFLSLYGHFGGEDLEEIDEGEEAAFKALRRERTIEDGGSGTEEEEEEEEGEGRIGERSALLGRGHNDRRNTVRQERGNKSSNRSQPTSELRSSSRRKRRRRSVSRGRSSRYPGFKDGSNGDASVTQAVLMLLKSLVGTGVLFLAKAFANGGLLFSVVTLILISMISLFSFVLLVETRLEIPGGFGEIGGILYGKWCRRTILFSLVISQIGFVAAYTIFIAQNLQAFIFATTNCQYLVPIYVLIFGQTLVYLPLAMIRNIQKLSGTALVADAFILIGLLYVFSFEFNSILTKGVAPIVLFNSESFPLLVGTAVFAFEGIGLVIPITESMKEPEKFPNVLSGVMFGLTILFAGAGALGYLAFGSDVEAVVLLNLPQNNKFVNAVQFLYSMAIMLSTPLQLFPAVRIMENGLFSSSGKYSNQVKWQKNSFRTITVIVCSLIAWTGAEDLDKFVSLIGSMACVPLCFCYPALLHYRAIARTTRQKFLDICLFIFGVAAAIYTSYQTLVLLIDDKNDNSSSRGDGANKYGNCIKP